MSVKSTGEDGVAWPNITRRRAGNFAEVIKPSFPPCCGYGRQQKGLRSNGYHDQRLSRISGNIFPGGFRNVIDGVTLPLRFALSLNPRFAAEQSRYSRFQSLRVAVFINNVRLFNR